MVLAVAAVGDVVHTLYLLLTEQSVGLSTRHMEAQPTAGLVAAHARARLSLARPPVELAQIAGLWENGGGGGGDGFVSRTVAQSDTRNGR